MRPFLTIALGCLASFAAAAQQAPPNLAVDATASVHPISPYVYGINEYADNGLAGMMRIPLRRFGGDATTSYNWQIDVSNSAADWYFQNNPQYSGKPALPDGSSFDLFHEGNLQTGSLSLGTISLMDWTPKDTSSCSFNVAKYGKQEPSNAASCAANPLGSQCAVDPYDSACGSGLSAATGQQIVNDPSDAYQPSNPAFEQQWVKYLLQKYGPGNTGGVRMWSMDNEPEWWDGVHTDIYPHYATYDDMMARSLTWGQAVKAVDPTALITGPVPSGWPGYFYSRTDMQSGWGTAPYQYWDNPTDQKKHGGVPWVEYYLQQMQQFEQQNGYRLLDAVDVHGYLAPDTLNQTAGDAAMETLRMTSTRALWDPNYIVPNSNASDNQYDAKGNLTAAQLIPRMHQWVTNNYPGTKLAITEYMWYALGSITGAITQADILGIFGRESLDYGTLWGPPAPTDPGAFAFKIFLNYDGNGSQFGGTSVSATTDNADALSIFAAQRYDSALTILVLNKTAGAIADSIGLAHFVPAGTAQVWQYSPNNLKAIVRQTPDLAAGNSVSTTFPAYSMTLLVIPQAQSAMSVPQPAISSIAGSASYDATAVSPGEIVSIFGQGLGPAAGVNLQLDSNGLVTTSLGGTQVFVNGNPAPLTYVAKGQINAVIPYEVAPAQTASVVVVYQGNASAASQIAIAAVKPGIFTGNSSGHGQGAILNQDYSVNGPANPAPRGQYVIIYGTGEGVTTPPGMDGRVSATAGTPLPNVAASCTATIGGQPATVAYCGEAAELTSGVLQLNVLVPQSVTPGGAVPVTVTIGGVTSQAGVTLAVQ
jgi:uncharacterized protein (TIGR03437 family)